MIAMLANMGQLTCDMLRYGAIWCVSGDLIRLRSRSNLVEGRLFAIIDLLLREKIIILYFIWRVGLWFTKNKSQIKKKTAFCF